MQASAKDIPAAYRLSEIMQLMWVNFAKTGDPVKEGSDLLMDLFWLKIKDK